MVDNNYDNKYNKEFGKRVKNLRKELGMTMEELGNRVNLHESTVQRYESGGIKQLSIEKVKEFAKALNISPADLMGWDQIEADYQRSTDLGYTYFKGLMKWSEDKLLKKHETTIIRGHMSDLFLRYKELMEQYVYAQRRWDREKESFSNFYKQKEDPLSDEEVKELYLEHELKRNMEDLVDWVNALPSWVAREEIKYNKLLNQTTLDDNSHLLPNAAHEIEGASTEDKAHDDDLMDDDDF